MSETPELPKKLCELAVEIDEIRAQIDKAVKFAKMVSDNPMIFCKSEIEAVNVYLATLSRRRDEKTQKLADAVELYRKKVLMIRSTLAKRKILLEEIDESTKVLSDNSALMETFAKGHAMLQQEMNRAETEIGAV